MSILNTSPTITLDSVKKYLKNSFQNRRSFYPL